jgi:hypothetical protein
MRGEREIQLRMLEPAAARLAELAVVQGGSIETRAGPIFQPTGRPESVLSYRAARNVMRRACRDAGLPHAESSDIRAACAHWLGSGVISDHEIADILGLMRVRSVDRLRKRHAALDAQRSVKEILNRR